MGVDLEEGTGVHAPLETPILVVRDLTLSSRGRTIFRNLDLDICTRRILFVMGASGSGKTLLLRALASLDSPETGRIELRGQTAESIGLPEWRTQVAYVPRVLPRLEGTPGSTFLAATALQAQKGRSRGDLDLPTLAAELGLDPGVLAQPWRELAAGQAQRLALAIGIALAPAVLLVDDPCGGLDTEHTIAVARVLARTARRGAGIVWVSSDRAAPLRIAPGLSTPPDALELPFGAVYRIWDTPAQPAAATVPSTTAASGPEDSNPVVHAHPVVVGEAEAGEQEAGGACEEASPDAAAVEEARGGEDADSGGGSMPESMVTAQQS